MEFNGVIILQYFGMIMVDMGIGNHGHSPEWIDNLMKARDNSIIPM